MVSAWMLWSAYALEKHDLAAYAGGRAKVLENPRLNTRRGPTTIYPTPLHVMDLFALQMLADENAHRIYIACCKSFPLNAKPPHPP